MNKPLPSIIIQALAPLSEQDFSDVLKHLNESRISYAFEQRQPMAYASLDWLIPTAVVVYITHSYFDGILKEIGKEHYQWFKSTLSSLYKKALGNDHEVEFTLVSAGKPKTPSHFSGTLSFLYTNELGYRIKLLFPLDVTADDYALSCNEFIKLITTHEKRIENEPLGEEIMYQAQAKLLLTGSLVPLERIRPTISLLVFWNRNSQCFHVADPGASSKSGKLISREIGVHIEPR